MNNVARMAYAECAELFAEAAGRRKLPDALVEKDFWVCWVLGQLFSTEALKGHLLFKGGTSLSKVFNVIQRFSEDIDIAVDYSLLGFTGDRDPLQPRLSKTKRTKLLESMMVECQRLPNRRSRMRRSRTLVSWSPGGGGEA